MIKIQPYSEFKPGNRGFFTGIPMIAYRNAPGVNQSLLKTVAERPSHKDKPSNESTDAQTWGTLFNDLLFFGTREYYVRPETYESLDEPTKKNPFPEPETKDWNGNSKVCKMWMASHVDKPILQQHGSHSVDWLDAAYAKCMADPRIVELLKGAQFEVSIFGFGPDEFHNPLVKGRPDVLKILPDRVIMADLKTTIRGSTRGFSGEIKKYGYHKQLAHYRQIIDPKDEILVEPYFIILEKGSDPRVQLRRLAPRAIDQGEMEINDDWKIFSKCKLTSSWPDFGDEPEPHVIGEIDLPDYAYGSDVEELEGMTEVEEEHELQPA